MSAIPLADAPVLRRVIRRTDAIRLVLAALLLGLLVALAVLAGHARVRTLHLLPAGSTAIVALDLSSSVSEDTYARIGATLSDLAASNGRYGLVVFSDVAYEALPPGTRSAELRSLVRYFTLPEQKTPGFIPTFPANPWSRTFSAGTRISTGLELARRLALDTRLHRPGVILVSDLSDDPADLRRVALTVLAYRRDRIPLRIVGLNPVPADTQFFRRLLGPESTITDARLPDERTVATGRGGVPWVLGALALALAVALVANELLLARVTWSEAR
ncbi:vWA domain-containing protein [Gaiella sp.]|uniref:vWA domain-containing protein n=1 Tax=Gaiella sp. TaxID=2663207 RepID=UPI002E35E467|nr:vWA domain-containing protein [Gaiella sp.]HEX5584061.1 vWA domain-containing protein [Gaiella sp.]